MHVKADTPVEARASYEQRACVKPVPIPDRVAIPKASRPMRLPRTGLSSFDTRSHRSLQDAMHPFRNDPSPRRLSVGMPT